jgi:hypothetical protein
MLDARVDCCTRRKNFVKTIEPELAVFVIWVPQLQLGTTHQSTTADYLLDGYIAGLLWEMASECPHVHLVEVTQN